MSERCLKCDDLLAATSESLYCGGCQQAFATATDRIEQQTGQQT